jgi:hypothetical protein
MEPRTRTPPTLVLGILLTLSATLPAAEQAVDICVYGGTAAGVMAAVSATGDGRRVLLVEPSRNLGGMTGGGIGTIDYGARATIGGLTDAYFTRFHPPGSEPQQARLEEGLRELLAAHGVTVLREHRLAAVSREGVRIRSITVAHAPPDPLGTPAATALDEPQVTIAARVFIDAGYEGDLMAGARVPYVVGREAAATHGETLGGRRAPARLYAVDPWRIPGDPTSGLLPLVGADDGLPEGAADDGVPAANFRLQLTQDPADRAMFPDVDDLAPGTTDRSGSRGYDPARYELLGRWMAAQVAAGTTPRLPFAIYHGHEFNDNRDELVSLALVGGMRDYLDGDWATRARVWRDHVRYTVGLFRFLASDPRVPKTVRGQAAAWGPRRSAFPATNGWPHQLYIRQGRRMVGGYVVTQHDLDGTAHVDDGIALGSYKVDLYHCRRYASPGGVAIEGKVFTTLGTQATGKTRQDNNGSHAYAISYRALTPRADACDNLLVPVCLSCSNVADSSLRMEPVYMVLGEAAGHAAAEAVASDRAVQAIDQSRLRERLIKAGQVLALP